MVILDFFEAFMGNKYKSILQNMYLRILVKYNPNVNQYWLKDIGF